MEFADLECGIKISTRVSWTRRAPEDNRKVKRTESVDAAADES